MFIPVAPNQSSSPFAMELGQKLTMVVREYQQSHPGLRGSEVREALRIAETNSGAAGARGYLGLVVTMLAVLVLVLDIFPRAGRFPRPGSPSAFAPFVLVIALVLLLVYLRRSRR